MNFFAEIEIIANSFFVNLYVEKDGDLIPAKGHRDMMCPWVELKKFDSYLDVAKTLWVALGNRYDISNEDIRLELVMGKDTKRYRYSERRFVMNRAYYTFANDGRWVGGCVVEA